MVHLIRVHISTEHRRRRESNKVLQTAGRAYYHCATTDDKTFCCTIINRLEREVDSISGACGREGCLLGGGDTIQYLLYENRIHGA